MGGHEPASRPVDDEDWGCRVESNEPPPRLRAEGGIVEGRLARRAGLQNRRNDGPRWAITACLPGFGRSLRQTLLADFYGNHIFRCKVYVSQTFVFETGENGV